MAARLTIAVLSFLLLASAVWGCSVPPGGCVPRICQSLTRRPVQNGPGVGFWWGVYNKNLNRSLSNQRGGPAINYEVFQEVGHVLAYSKTAKTLSACCFECARTPGCVHYQFFDSPTPSRGKRPVPGFFNSIQCYLLKGGRVKVDDPQYGTPFSGTRAQNQEALKIYDSSWLGGKCNPGPKVVDDPHFTGALGTRFDFNGELDKSFCLTADKKLQVNILLRGYENSNSKASGGPSKAVRSWIKEVGLIWFDEEGTRHVVHMVARRGKEQERGDGFMARLLVDGAKTEIPSARNQNVEAPGGFSLKFVGVEKRGKLDEEEFALEITGHVSIALKMRVAHPLLQSPEDAHAHFNIEFSRLVTTPAVHGVLGQTYRGTEDRVKRALEYRELSRLLHAPVVADGETGKGFLDGDVADYVTSDIAMADCRYSSMVLPA